MITSNNLFMLYLRSQINGDVVAAFFEQKLATNLTIHKFNRILKVFAIKVNELMALKYLQTLKLCVCVSVTNSKII